MTRQNASYSDDFAFDDFGFDEPAPPPAYAAGAEEYDVSGLGETGTDAPVPRISIHAFCDRPEIARMIETAASDRRLSKTTVRVSSGGVAAGIAHFASSGSVNLVILDSVAPPARLVSDIDRLAQVCDPTTKVIVIGATNDIRLYRELMKRGISEYLVPPVQPLDMVKSIAGLFLDPAQPFVGRVVAFMGVKGGVGSSTLAHNIAWCLSERADQATTLVDLDLSFGTTGLDFNQDNPQSVVEALLQPDRVDDVLLERLVTRHTDRLSLFVAPSTVDREFDIHPSAYEILIDTMRRSSPYIVLDLPHSWSTWTRHTLISADEVVLVAQPDLASLRNGKNIVDVLKAARPNDAPPRLLLNMVGVPKRPEIPVKDFAEAMGVLPSAVVPFDPQSFGQAANNGQMLLETQPGSMPAKALEEFTRRLIGREIAQKRKPLLELPKLKKK